MASAPAGESAASQDRDLQSELDSVKRDLEQEGLRLEKLWDAYKVQEEEYQEALSRIRSLEEALEEKDAARAERERTIREREESIRALEGEKKELEVRLEEMDRLKEELAALDAYKDRVAELEQAYQRERERLAKLYLVYEDVERERDELKEKFAAGEKSE